MVVVEITRWPTATRGPVGHVIEVLGLVDEPGVDTQIIIRKFNIPDAHSLEAVEEARRIGDAVKEKDIRGRTDFRNATTVTTTVSTPGTSRRNHNRRLTSGNYGSACTSTTSPNVREAARR